MKPNNKNKLSQQSYSNLIFFFVFAMKLIQHLILQYKNYTHRLSNQYYQNHEMETNTGFQFLSEICNKRATTRAILAIANGTGLEFLYQICYDYWRLK